MPKDRRHAAIMFTDIVGYTRLMGTDEEKAVDMLSRNRTIHQSCIEKFNGILIKEIGDGTLASFPLTSDSVRCAVEIQKACKEQDIPLKVGMHQGELILSGTDILGDAVNIASRLQEDAQEGCIAISGKVYSDIKNRADFNAKYIRKKKFKNVDEAISIYNVIWEEGINDLKLNSAWSNKTMGKSIIYVVAGLLVVVISTLMIWKYIPFKDKVELEISIAVLPFKNLSQDVENQYFADGIMEGILNHLSKIKDLRVASRSSTEKYRENIPQAQQIVKELDVSYYIEASVFKSEDKIRVTAQLIDAIKDEHIWSEQYDRELSDLFDVMSEIAIEVASEVKVRITPEVKVRLEAIPTENLEAYDLYLRGREYLYKGTESNLNTAIHFYQRAIELDPEFALAYVWLGMAYHEQFLWSEYFKESYADTLKYYADKALSLNPYLAEGYWLRGNYYYEKGDYDESIIQLKKAIDLNPNHGDSYLYVGENYKRKGQYINTIINLEKAKKLKMGDPDYSNSLVSLAGTYLGICDYEKTEIELTELLDYNPSEGYFWLAFLSLINGEWDKCKLYTDKTCAMDSGLMCWLSLERYYRNTGDYAKALKYVEKYRDKEMESGLLPLYQQRTYGQILYNLGRNKESKEYFNKQIEYSKESIRLKRPDATWVRFQLAGAYAFLDEKEKAYQTLHEFEQEVLVGHLLFWYIQIDSMFESLWEDEEFKAIIQRQEKKFADIKAEVDRLEEEGELL
jgi:TolB-like protein/Tfp pilus assembly protein PilF